MKTKVYSIYISFIFLALSTITIFIFYFVHDFYSKSLILNIGYSIFGGSILAFAIYIVEYLTIKRKTVNDFYDEALAFANALNAIDFYDISDKELIVAEYIFLRGYLETNDEAKKEFINRATKAFVNSGYKANTEDIMPTINMEIDSFERAIVKTMMSYIEFSKYLSDRLIRISNEIYFFSKSMRKSHKENIEMCNMVIQAIEKVARPAMHFDLYLKRESSNIVIVTKLVKELNSYFFKIERKNNITLAWKEKMNEYNNLLNQFICAFNGKKYKKQEYSPFYQSPFLKGPWESKRQ